MLKQLIIKNFIFINDASLKFSPSFNVITGETGAGKSILLNALGITLGNKIDLNLIGPSKNKIEVTSIFDIHKNTMIKKKYSHLGIGEEEEIILKREISKDGKSRCLINGQPTNLSLLKEISEKLIDIHSQHQNQHLFNSDYHLFFFDQTLNLKEELTHYKKCFFQLKELRKLFNEVDIEEAQLKEEKEFILYSMKEFEGKFLNEKEYSELKNRLKEVETSEKNYHTLTEFKESIDKTVAGMEKASSTLLKLSLSETLKIKSKELLSLIDQIQELGETILQNYDYQYNHNYLYEIDQLNQKLSGTEKLLRKYNTNHSTLINKYESLKTKLNRLENAEYEKKKILTNLKQVEIQCWEAALMLHRIRQDGIKSFEDSINKEIKDLEIKNANFLVALTPELKDSISHDSWIEYFNDRGLNKLEFLYSPGKGIDAKPLKKIASGGELSRIMLAIKHLLNQSLPNETIIFDEIDTGVGGIAAVKIGKKIKEISNTKQVIVVTHLPQIAKFANRHFRIEKITNTTGKSQTKINLLDKKELLTEFTRMMGKEASAENLKLTEKLIYEK